MEIMTKSVADDSRLDGSLAERLLARLKVEDLFTRRGHTHRHGPMHRVIDQKVVRPGVTLLLRCLGLFERGRRNALNPIVREITLSFRDLPKAFDGFRLLHMSDLHIDGVPGLPEAIVSVLRGVSVDLCLLTGDYRFDDRGPCEAVYPAMRKVLAGINSRLGIYGILGNHDVGEIAYRLEEMGVRMLVNESAEIQQDSESIWLVGIDDNFDYQCHDLALALKQVPAGAFKILLAHAPELFEDANASGIHLCLGGHTHGGQIRVPVLGALKQNARCPKSYAWGLWRHGQMQGYTSCGIGCSTIPVRYNCPGEAIIFELRRA
jgi:predicted MPP superfamily phosphohydrolase